MGGPAPLPWSFVNGAGKGYSIKLISSSPEPGTALHPGQSLEFQIDLSYELGVADEGSIVLVFQADSDKSLKPGSTQQHVDVKRGAGSVTLQDTLLVPEGVREIRLFIPIVPKGMSKTSGEMILRYPVVTEVHSSTSAIRRWRQRSRICTVMPTWSSGRNMAGRRRTIRGTTRCGHFRR